MKVRFILPHEYPMVEEFCERENIKCPHPQFSYVVAAIDEGRVVGIVVTQMLIHTEPIWIEKKYQGRGIKEQMMDLMEDRIDEGAIMIGGPVHVYAEPTNVASERICRKRGFTQSERKFWCKEYTGERFLKKFAKGE